MPKPLRSSNSSQEMYFIDGKRLSIDWIHYAVRCRNDDVGSNQGAGTLNSTSIASDVNLAD
jgi:hypothetical protein